VCVAGARWVQKQILEAHPDAELSVLAIWFGMFPGDSRSRWPESLLTDARVRHYWDEERLTGRLYGERVTAQEPGHVEWDAWFLYDGEGVWGSGPPTPLVGWGRTIVSTREELRRELEALLEEPPTQSTR
jgi:hypothetical protein